MFKGIEHGTVKEVSGKEIDNMLKDAEEYLTALNKLFKKIQTRRNKESIDEMSKTAVDLVTDVLKAEGVKTINKAQIVSLFKIHLVEKKKMLPKHLETLKLILKTKKEYTTKKISPQELEKANREARMLFKVLSEDVQRKLGPSIDKVKIRFRYGQIYGEAILLGNKVFIVEDIQAKEKVITEGELKSDGSFANMQKSSFENLERQISEAKLDTNIFVKEKTFESLKKLFGADVEILLNY
jgi:hypothetical protein